MTETTKEQLVSAAAQLLDSGGQGAVTLRAVARRVGVSHNAPYRHFRDRSALLSAVAERDLEQLRREFESLAGEGSGAAEALRQSAGALIAYAREHPARYRLLFSDPDLTPQPGLGDAALAAFEAFTRIVSWCQREGVLPSIDAVSLTGLIYAAIHGAIDLQLGGRASDAKGLASIDATVALLFDLLRTVETPGPRRRTQTGRGE